MPAPLDPVGTIIEAAGCRFKVVAHVPGKNGELVAQHCFLGPAERKGGKGAVVPPNTPQRTTSGSSQARPTARRTARRRPTRHHRRYSRAASPKPVDNTNYGLTFLLIFVIAIAMAFLSECHRKAEWKHITDVLTHRQ